MRVALAAGVAAAAAALLLLSRRRRASRQFRPRTISESRARSVSGSRLLDRPDACDRFACFLSHFKIQCASEARLLQAELETSLGRRCFLDSDDLKDLRELTEHVRKSEVLVLIQSSGVLKRPWCLLELVTAIDARIPIVGVALASGPYAYDFRAASEILRALGEPGQLDDDAVALLEAQGVSLDDAARKLSSVIPSMVSIALDPFASRTVLAATLFDVVEAMKEALSKPPMQLMSHEEWCRSKEKAAALHGKASKPPPAHGAASKDEPARRTTLAAIPDEVPELPAAFQPRSELSSALQESVRNNRKGSATTSVTAPPRSAAALTTTTSGMGGVGKTMAAAALCRSPEIGRAFEAICWVSVGQEPDLLALQRTLHRQLANKPLPEATTDAAFGLGALREAALGKQVLCVLDDIWEASHVPPLSFVDADAGSALVITTRVRALVPNAAEVQCDVLSRPEALELLLTAGGVAHLIKDPPSAALRAVELCGKLPLALGIAGGIIDMLADTWQEELLDVLGNDLGGDTSIEERVVQASLRSMPHDSRAGVESLFVCFSIFAEDAVVPTVVLDIIAPLMEGCLESERKRKLLVRQWLKLLLKNSLAQGSIEHGVYVHDLIRDCMLRRAEAREGGQRELQRSALPLLLSVFDVEGPAAAYASSSLAHHVSRAIYDGAPLRGDALLMSVLVHPQTAVCRQAVTGLGTARVLAEIEELEGVGLWWEAAQLWWALSCVHEAHSGDELQRCWAAIKRVRPEGDETRVLEARVLNRLIFIPVGGFAFGTPEHSALRERLAELSASADFASHAGEALSALFAGLAGLSVSSYAEVSRASLAEAHGLHLQSAASWGKAEASAPAGDSVKREYASHWAAWCAINPASLHALPEFEREAFVGVGRALREKLREQIASYDFDVMHAPFKATAATVDIFLMAAAPQGLLLWYCDLDGARAGWSKMVDAWRRIGVLVRRGERKWVEYMYEDALCMSMVGTMLAGGAMDLARELLAHTLSGIACADPSVESELLRGYEDYPFLKWRGPSGECYSLVETFRLRARALLALVDESCDESDAERSRAWLPPPEELVGIAQRETFYNMQISGMAHPAVACAALYGDRLGAWDAALTIAQGVVAIPTVQMQPLVRIEAWRLIARGRSAAGEAAAAREAHAEALKEAEAARYGWMARRLSEDAALYGV